MISSDSLELIVHEKLRFLAIKNYNDIKTLKNIFKPLYFSSLSLDFGCGFSITILEEIITIRAALWACVCRAGDDVWTNLNVCRMITRLDICGSRGLSPWQDISRPRLMTNVPPSQSGASWSHKHPNTQTQIKMFGKFADLNMKLIKDVWVQNLSWLTIPRGPSGFVCFD